MRYLTVKEIRAVAITHLGAYQVRDEGQIEYLVDVVSRKIFGVEQYPTLTQKAAVYAHHIITGHPFWDGNKRIGMNCATIFLEINGRCISEDAKDSMIDLGFKIAKNEITDIETIAEHIQSWLL